MRRFFNWQIALGLVLIVLSLLFYEAEYLIFGDAKHIMLYFFQDLAFVFVEVLLVTLVLHRLLAFREKKALMQKMNMVIGAFFSEVGTALIRSFRSFDTDPARIGTGLVVTTAWDEKKFRRMRKAALGIDHKIDCAKGDLPALKEFLVSRRPFLLGLLENPNLLEHETFTNLLWAVFHLTEELASRPGLKGLPETDYAHLAGDIRRAYGLLISEWLAYMAHLKTSYPYLFSLAVRTNPFDPNASVIVS